MDNRGVLFQYFEWNSKNDGSLWRQLAESAAELKHNGFTAVWVPPPYKAAGGTNDVGYAVYDMYDLGEFDQKGAVRTKYGTRDEFVAAVKALRAQNLHVYIDTVFNHRMGGDTTEEVEVEEIDKNDRNQVATAPYKIKAWCSYEFPGRAGKYSNFKWHAEHFNAFGRNADAPDEDKIFRKVGKSFSGEVDFEMGNFDYLMGADVDVYHPDVRADLTKWGKWIIETTGANGYRLDAVKHIPSSFIKDWLREMREGFKDRELFAVAEYWHTDVGQLKKYLADVDNAVSLFDAPLHYRFMEASCAGKDYDLRQIFDNTLVKDDPQHAVTFVENHDSQPGQSLCSDVQDWFKQHAYALILLRQDGYPCVFYGDYYGNDHSDHKLVCHSSTICQLLEARKNYMFGDQHDYFDDAHCVGWVWTGDKEHPSSLVVLMSNSDACSKQMKTWQGAKTYRDLTGHWPEPVTTDENGDAEFKCAPGKVSVWVPAEK